MVPALTNRSKSLGIGIDARGPNNTGLSVAWGEVAGGEVTCQNLRLQALFQQPWSFSCNFITFITFETLQIP